MCITWRMVLLGMLGALVFSSSSFSYDDSSAVSLNRQWAEGAFSATRSAPLPFSFVYNGQASKNIIGSWTRTVTEDTSDPTVRCRTLTITDPATHMQVRAVVNIYTDTAGVDWTIHFTNSGTGDTPFLEQVRAVDTGVTFGAGTALTVHRLNGGGGGVDDWMPFDNVISQGSRIDFSSGGGRSSNVCPFFNADWGTGGVITAIGWSGQWTATVNYASSGTATIQAGMQSLRLKLHPGESIRSPRIMQVRWTGSDHIASYNLFRHTMFSHVMPRIDDQVVTPPIVHLSTSFYELNGSTEANTLSHMDPIKGLGFEGFWLDAYWTKWGFPGGMGNYGFPITRAEPADRFPNGIRPIGDAAHAEGMKFVLWFEPERVAPGTELALEHPEWVMSPGLDGSGLYNLGIPEARQYMTDYLTTVIEAYGMDCLRIDYNIAPLGYWQYMDSLESDRVGMAEIRYMEGLYKMWDDIRAARPHIFIDNCASGGQRIDLETCSRAIPLWRTDATISPLFSGDFNQASLQNQVMTAGLSRYMPFSTSGQMGFMPYQFRGGFNAGISFCEDVRPASYPKATLAQAIAEGKRIRRYYFGDFYPLTQVTTSPADWCILQYHLPETDEGIVLAFRRQAATQSTYECAAREIDPQANYEVHCSHTYDRGPAVIVSGDQLAQLLVEIPEKPGSVIIEYKKTASVARGLVIGTVCGTLPGATATTVPNAIVRVVGAPIGAFTDDGGQYSLPLAPGTYTLTCEMAGFGSDHATVTIEENGTIVQDFMLQMGLLTGKVTANSPGQPAVSGATVQTVDGSLSTQTDASGTYSLIVPFGTQTLTVIASGFAAETADVTVQIGSPAAQDFCLDYVVADSVSDQFGFTNAPNGLWTYGWQQPLGSGISLYDQLSNPSGDARLQMWNMMGDLGAGVAGLVWKNTSTSASDQWGRTEAGQVCMHPGPQNQYATARWTARVSGTIGIAATFSGQNSTGATTDVHVFKNGVSLFAGQVSGFAGRKANSYSDRTGSSPVTSYTGTTNVLAGDTIDFAVGYGGVDYSCDLTGLDARITLVHDIGSLCVARQAIDGLVVRTSAQVAATTSTGAFDTRSFYVEDQNRVSGIKVIALAGQASVTTGQRVRVTGTVGRDSRGEVAILNASLSNLTSGVGLSPLGVSSSSIVDCAPEVLGILVRLWGRVTYVAADSSYYYVNDGRSRADASGHVGVRVIPKGGTVPSEGQYVGVTGVVGLALDGVNTVTTIRARSASDFRTY